MGPFGGDEEFRAALDRRLLEALEWNWGEAYEFRAGEVWTARRRDGLGGLIEAPDPEGLRAGVLADYLLKPVPRQPDHEPEPKTDTAYTMTGPRAGRLLDMRYGSCWPAEGICSCGEVVRRESRDEPWEHTGRKPGETGEPG